MRVAELCAGYSGLFMGIKEVFPEAELSWVAENDSQASLVLARHYPGVPNYGDISKIQYFRVPKVDLLAAGFPCQPLSHAGKKRGGDDERWLWDEVARAVRALRPRLVLLENVPGIRFTSVSSSILESCSACLDGESGVAFLRALGAVAGDLSEMRYRSRWISLPASAAGAPHERERVFILAADTDLDVEFPPERGLEAGHSMVAPVQGDAKP